MKLRYAITVLLVAAGCFASKPAATAQERTFTLKLSHWLQPSHPVQQAMEDWAASIEKDSGGSLRAKIYPAENLGKAIDHYDMARDGIADMSFVGPGYEPGRFPIIEAGELPFLMSNAKGGSVALDTWYRQYATKEMSDVKFCLAFVHEQGTLHTISKKVTLPADIKGIRVRPASGTMARFIRSLGGSDVPAAAPDVRAQLEHGKVDAVTFPWGSVRLFGIDKLVRHHMNVPLYTTTFVLVLNKTKYEQISAKQKKVIDNHCSPQWARKIAEPWADFERDGFDRLKREPGQDIYNLTPAQLIRWQQAAAPLAKQWADSASASGIDTAAALQELKAALKKEKAAY